MNGIFAGGYGELFSDTHVEYGISARKVSHRNAVARVHMLSMSFGVISISRYLLFRAAFALGGNGGAGDSSGLMLVG